MGPARERCMAPGSGLPGRLAVTLRRTARRAAMARHLDGSTALHAAAAASRRACTAGSASRYDRSARSGRPNASAPSSSAPSPSAPSANALRSARTSFPRSRSPWTVAGPSTTPGKAPGKAPGVAPGVGPGALLGLRPRPAFRLLTAVVDRAAPLPGAPLGFLVWTVPVTPVVPSKRHLVACHISVRWALLVAATRRLRSALTARRSPHRRPGCSRNASGWSGR